jgi:hypothetical protein
LVLVAVEPTKTLRIEIPLGQHLKLHALRVLLNQSVSDTVTLALDLYFQKHPVPQA